METGTPESEAIESYPELRNRCQPWNVDDPLANYLKGVPSVLSLRTGAFLGGRTTDLFEQMRGQDVERLYSFFKLNRGALPQIWRDVMPTNGTTWASRGELAHGVARFNGLPLDGEACRVMDIHNHPFGYSEAPSVDDTSFFLIDIDMQVQVVVSEKGAQVLAKQKNYNPSKFNQDEYDYMYRETHDKNLGNSVARDKEFTKWVAKKYGLNSYWIKRGSNLVVPYR